MPSGFLTPHYRWATITSVLTAIDAALAVDSWVPELARSAAAVDPTAATTEPGLTGAQQILGLVLVVVSILGALVAIVVVQTKSLNKRIEDQSSKFDLQLANLNGNLLQLDGRVQTFTERLDRVIEQGSQGTVSLAEQGSKLRDVIDSRLSEINSSLNALSERVAHLEGRGGGSGGPFV